MLTALDSSGNTIIVTDYDGARLDSLREQGRHKQLRCPGCKEPVFVKAGEFRERHFSHWAKSNCPYANVSAELLEARIVLYQWLKTKFPTGVTVEKILTGEPAIWELPRAVDCWVDRPGDRALAYWIFDRGVNPEKRHKILYGFDWRQAALIVVFVQKMLKFTEAGDLNLGTTERAAVENWPSDYDRMQPGYDGKASLHYLDAKAASMTTFRAIQYARACHDFTGTKHTTPMTQVTICPKTGGFVHPGEYDQVTLWRTEERARKLEAERMRRWLAGIDEEQEKPSQPKHTTDVRVPTVPPATSTPTVEGEREGICEICGKRTTDWYMFSPPDRCKCNECLRSGRT